MLREMISEIIFMSELSMKQKKTATLQFKEEILFKSLTFYI
jgi:hypothetical protein